MLRGQTLALPWSGPSFFLTPYFFQKRRGLCLFMALNQRIDARSASVHGLLRAMVRQRYSFHAFPL